jgi:hypothetical protein
MNLVFDPCSRTKAPIARAAACASKTTMIIITTPTSGAGRTRAT